MEKSKMQELELKKHCGQSFFREYNEGYLTWKRIFIDQLFYIFVFAELFKR